MDYANGLLVRLPDLNIKHMQQVQNMAAKVVLNLRKHDSSTDTIKPLHWLPIRQLIEYKIINLTQQCIHRQAPNYLKKLLEIHKPNQAGLRSSSTAHKWDLKVKFTRKRTFADRSFTITAPKLWNQLSASLKKITSNDTFRKQLKTYLFCKSI